MLLTHFLEFSEERHPVPWTRAGEVRRAVTQRSRRTGIRKEKGKGKEGRERKHGVEDSREIARRGKGKRRRETEKGKNKE